MNFYGSKGNLTVTDCFYQTPGARVECKHEDGDLFVLDTKTDTDLPHFDNYRREFEHISECLLNKTQHSPSENDVLSDARLLDALKQNVPAITVPTPEAFLK